MIISIQSNAYWLYVALVTEICNDIMESVEQELLTNPLGLYGEIPKDIAFKLYGQNRAAKLTQPEIGCEKEGLFGATVIFEDAVSVL